MVMASPEYTLPSHREINAAFLSKENHSSLALARLKNWKEAKAEGQLVETWSCDDARVSVATALGTFDLLSIRTIAAAGDPKPFKYMIDHPSVKFGVTLGHYDSSLQVSGEVLPGCGGEAEKAKRINVVEAAPDDVAQGYVDRHIESHDVVYQTLRTAWKTAQLSNSGKPILAGLLDTITYRIIPIGYFNGNGREYIGIIPFDEVAGKQRQIITPELLSEIDISRIPPALQRLLINNRNMSDQLVHTPIFEEFRKSQKVQNPPLVLVSTSVIPIGVRYPGLNTPNTVFKAGLPFVKSDEGGAQTLEEADIKRVIAQVHYPISHTLTAKEGQVFYGTRTILIETPKMEMSQHIMGELRRRDWFKKWEIEKGGKIIIAEVQSGKIQSIQDVEPRKS